jgi:hypothetical protein
MIGVTEVAEKLVDGGLDRLMLLMTGSEFRFWWV